MKYWILLIIVLNNLRFIVIQKAGDIYRFVKLKFLIIIMNIFYSCSIGIFEFVKEFRKYQSVETQRMIRNLIQWI